MGNIPSMMPSFGNNENQGNIVFLSLRDLYQKKLKGLIPLNPNEEESIVMQIRNNTFVLKKEEAIATVIAFFKLYEIIAKFRKETHSAMNSQYNLDMDIQAVNENDIKELLRSASKEEESFQQEMNFFRKAIDRIFSFFNEHELLFSKNNILDCATILSGDSAFQQQQDLFETVFHALLYWIEGKTLSYHSS